MTKLSLFFIFCVITWMADAQSTESFNFEFGFNGGGSVSVLGSYDYGSALSGQTGSLHFNLNLGEHFYSGLAYRYGLNQMNIDGPTDPSVITVNYHSLFFHFGGRLTHEKFVLSEYIGLGITYACYNSFATNGYPSEHDYEAQNSIAITEDLHFNLAYMLTHRLGVNCDAGLIFASPHFEGDFTFYGENNDGIYENLSEPYIIQQTYFMLDLTVGLSFRF